jgi:hypothetical protein
MKNTINPYIQSTWLPIIVAGGTCIYHQDSDGTHWIGGWVSLVAGLDAEATRKILCICRGGRAPVSRLSSV